MSYRPAYSLVLGIFSTEDPASHMTLCQVNIELATTRTTLFFGHVRLTNRVSLYTLYWP